MPKHGSVESLEQEIVRMKSELVRMSRTRNLALRDGRRDEGERHHLSALEAELKHVDTLARYVQTASPAAGRELATRRSLALRHFERIKGTRNIREVNRWVTEELAPLVNKSEQAAHLVASMSSRLDGMPSKPSAWKTRPER